MSRAEPVSEASDDAALVEAALAGDPTAFDHLVTRHRRAVYHVCYRFVHHHEDAADLTQDTFLRAWRALGHFRAQARFSTWIYRIAVNVSLNKVGARSPHTDVVDVDLVADLHQPPPSDGLFRDERRVAVRRAVQSLPPRQRTALILRTYHELTHQEVAEIVGTSVGAVKANVFHALANLRRRLESLR
jgi:RNA polymerase sigma-70 factor (ECF subfamily)